MQKCILIVDDDQDDIVALEDTLKKNGYAVVSCDDPELAIEKARRLHFDLIILDEVMPKLFGSEVGRILSDDPKTRHIPLLFLTALKEPTDEVWGRPMNVVLSKAQSKSDLLEAIDKLIV